MSDDFSIQDLGTLGEEEKKMLVEYCRAAFADDVFVKQKTAKKSITLAREEKVIYKLVAEQEDKKPQKTVEEAVSELGLSEEAARKLIKGYQARDIKRYHLSDIKYLSDLLQMLEPAGQKKAVDIIVQNRKELYHVNKEDVVMLLLMGHQISPYFAEIWYNGAIRTLEKINRKTEVGSDLLEVVDPIYKKDLKRKLKAASTKLNALSQKI